MTTTYEISNEHGEALTVQADSEADALDAFVAQGFYSGVAEFCQINGLTVAEFKAGLSIRVVA